MNSLVQKPAAKPASPQRAILQRKCACGSSLSLGGECEECRKKKLQRRESGPVSNEVPAAVGDVLQSPGRPLDAISRGFMEPRFGHDFSRVRIHDGARAAESSGLVNALAYTVGRDIVFGNGQYRPHTPEGRQLLAHELTHVVQQARLPEGNGGTALTIDPANSPLESEARAASSGILAGGQRGAPHFTGATTPVLSRADPDAVGYVTRLGNTPRTGLQFSPNNLTDTVVGPATVRGGLLDAGAQRLNVIISGNMTLHRLATQLLPLWITATPFTPPGAAAPLALDIITEDELARGLLVYNQFFLPVPAMTSWREGLLFPLPVEINATTGVGTLHPLQIRALAGAFNAAWVPLLDQRSAALVAQPAAALAADVTAFLAAQPTALERGVHLGARALTNAAAELPFLRETFRQLGAASFDVALEFMQNLVNREITLLAAQRDGAAILGEIRTALGGAPATPTADQQQGITRANLMLGLVAGTAAAAPPTAVRTRASKTITVDTVKLDGSSFHPSTQVALADAILGQCNIHVAHGVDATANNVQTTGWLGGDTDLRASAACGAVSAEERALFTGASATFGMGARFRAYFADTMSGQNASGYSLPPYCATGGSAAFRDTIVVVNSGDEATLAHELMHILRNSGTHPAGRISGSRPGAPAMRQPLINDAECTTSYNNA